MIGCKKACKALGRSRATHYRHKNPKPRNDKRKSKSLRAMSESERQAVLDELNSERFCDRTPRQVWATLLDEGQYLCSIPQMYRILKAENLTRVRRRERFHPAHVKPELVATKPNQVWSWDITKLHGPHKWNWFHLYVILDVHSRYAVGWMVAPRESAKLAEELIASCIRAEDIKPNQLSLHADRGSSMTSRTVSQMLADLGVLQSHSRPHQSNDNPFSESQFKTLKNFPTFPKQFSNIEATRSFVDGFFNYYNLEHRHSGIGFHTPFDVHTGRAKTIRKQRQRVLDAAHREHPERFRRRPLAPRIPAITFINKPEEAESAST